MARFLTFQNWLKEVLCQFWIIFILCFATANVGNSDENKHFAGNDPTPLVRDRMKYILKMSFKVTSVIDGDTFDVSPKWEWEMDSGETVTGNRVRIAGFNAPESGTLSGGLATAQLKKLIGGKNVELEKPVDLSFGRIVCDVFLDGTNIVKHLN